MQTKSFLVTWQVHVQADSLLDALSLADSYVAQAGLGNGDLTIVAENEVTLHSEANNDDKQSVH